MNVNNLLEGAAPYQVIADQSAKLAGKWSKSGLLEGIESSTERNNRWVEVVFSIHQKIEFSQHSN